MSRCPVVGSRAGGTEFALSLSNTAKIISRPGAPNHPRAWRSGHSCQDRQVTGTVFGVLGKTYDSCHYTNTVQAGMPMTVKG